MALIDNELSEPYSIFTYRYFIYNWPHLCFLAFDESTGRAFGTVVCKLDIHGAATRGYLAMLTVEKAYRGKQIGRHKPAPPRGLYHKSMPPLSSLSSSGERHRRTED
jgi:GNAT superfamily N-acetyltransferase